MYLHTLDTLELLHVVPSAWNNHPSPPLRYELSTSCFVMSLTPKQAWPLILSLYLYVQLLWHLTHYFEIFFIVDSSMHVLKGVNVLFIFCTLGP